MGVKQRPTAVIEHEQSGGPPLTQQATRGPYTRAHRAPRSRLERIVFWVIVAPPAIFLVLLGVINPACLVALYRGVIAACRHVDVDEPPRPSGWATVCLGSGSFPF